MKWALPILLAALLASAPEATHAAPPTPTPRPTLPACLPSQARDWPVVDENTQVQGRTIIVRQSPDGRQRCGTVKVSTRRPSESAPKRVRR